MHSRIVPCPVLKFRRFQSRWKGILHYSLNYDCPRKSSFHTGKARVTVANWSTSTGGRRKSTSFRGNSLASESYCSSRLAQTEEGSPPTFVLPASNLSTRNQVSKWSLLVIAEIYWSLRIKLHFYYCLFRLQSTHF